MLGSLIQGRVDCFLTFLQLLNVDGDKCLALDNYFVTKYFRVLKAVPFVLSIQTCHLNASASRVLDDCLVSLKGASISTHADDRTVNNTGC